MAKGDSERIKNRVYSFSVEKTVEKEVEEPRIEDGEEVLVKKTKTEKIPYTVVVLKPTRRQNEEAEMEYSIEMSRCIKQGILTRAMLQNKYSDAGGVMSDADTLRLQGLYAKHKSESIDFLELEAKENKTKKQKDRLSALEGEIAIIKEEILDIEMNYTNLFSHTADTKAQNRAITWYMLNLTYYFEDVQDDDIDLIPLFKGGSYDEKRDHYFKMDEDGDDEIFEQIKARLPSVVSLWYFSSEEVTEEEIKKLEKGLEESSE